MIHLQGATPVDIMHLAEITLMIMPCLVGPALCRKCVCAFRRSEQQVMTSDDLVRGGKAYQLSWAGFRLDWQCYGRVIMLLDQNHSLCLRMLVLSVLIRPLSASLSLWQQLSAACSVNLKTTLCLLLSSPHITPYLTLLFSTFDCVALLQWVLTIGSCTGRVTSAGARGYDVFGKIARNMFFHPTRCNLECNYQICREVPEIAN